MSHMVLASSTWIRKRQSSKFPTSVIGFGFFALYDGLTDEFASIGKQFGTKPGFYLMVGPNWKGEAPAGVNAVVRWVDAVEKYPAANRLLGDVFTCSWLGLF